MSRLALLSLLLAAPAFVACNGSSSPASNDGTSTVSGTIALSAYTGVDNPVVISRGASGRIFVAPVLRTGAFSMSLPAGDSYHFVLASTRADRSYIALSEIQVTGGVTWGRFGGAGTALDLGTVRPVGSTALAPQAGGVAAQDHGSDDSSSSGSGSGAGADDSLSSSGGGGGGGGDDDGTNAGSASTCKIPGEAKLPYDVKPQLGQTFRLTDAFLVEGPLPASVVSVTLDGGTWRLAELQANTPFTITQDDCSHQGNRDVGRDRIFVTWTNAGGGQQTDHLDLRYCEAGNRVPDDSATGPATTTPASGECGANDAPVCTPNASSMSESECTGGHMNPDSSESASSDDIPVCPPGSSTGTTAGSGAGGAGGAAGGATAGSGAGGSAGSAGSTGTAGSATGGAAGSATGSAAGGAAGTSGTTSGAGDVPAGGGCVTQADCIAGLACFASTCVIPIH